MELVIYPPLSTKILSPRNSDVATGKPDWTGNPLGDLSARGTGNRLVQHPFPRVFQHFDNQSYLDSHSLSCNHMSRIYSRIQYYVPITTYYSKHILSRDERAGTLF